RLRGRGRTGRSRRDGRGHPAAARRLRLADAAGRARPCGGVDLRSAARRGGVPRPSRGRLRMNGSMASTHGGTAVVALRPAQAIAVRRIPPGKRALDILLAGVGLIASAPLWCLIAAAVKLEDGGPIFYGQERVGEGGRVFRALKFRSMIANAEAGVGALQAAENDTRVTRVGRVLRATAMDELPQLLNILRGDMSFVGPRALRPGEVETGSGGRHEEMEAIPGYVER